MNEADFKESRTLIVVLLSRSIVKVSPSAMLTTLPWMVSCSFVVVGRQATELSRRNRRQIGKFIAFVVSQAFIAANAS
jgi:hypothetical protein